MHLELLRECLSEFKACRYFCPNYLFAVYYLVEVVESAVVFYRFKRYRTNLEVVDGIFFICIHLFSLLSGFKPIRRKSRMVFDSFYANLPGRPFARIKIYIVTVFTSKFSIYEHKKLFHQ
jgi:hypothetical protein